jgi:uncharacterized membrane protein
LFLEHGENMAFLRLIGLAAPFITFPGGSQAALILLRWIHLVAGIIWVGLLYFFVLVNADFLGQLDPASRMKVIPKLMPRAMWWFRWSSLVTVLAGFGYWNHIVATDARSAMAVGETASAGRVIGIFVAIWTIAFVIEMGLVMSPVPAFKNAGVLGGTMTLVLAAGGYAFLALNQQGWESNRTLAIGIGGGLGWFMMLNVWGIVWRMHKRIIGWSAAAVTEGTPMPSEAARMSQLASVVAKVNFWVSFPMLFFMGASSHYGMFVR